MGYFHTRASIFVLTLLACIPLLVLPIIPSNTLLSFTAEDSVIEWLGALAWAAASVVFMLTIRADRKANKTTAFRSFALVTLSAICFVAAGEEISWGQRVIGFDTPEIISDSNLQKEMNFHNLAIFDDRSSVDGTDKKGLASLLTFGRLGKLVWMGFLVALPLAVFFISPIRQLAQKLRVPSPPLSIAIACISCYVCSRILFNNAAAINTDPTVLKLSVDEVKETIIGIFFLCSALAIYSKSKKNTAPNAN